GVCYGVLDPGLTSGDAPSFVEPCMSFAAPPIAIAARSGSAATTVLRASTRLAYLEYPLSAASAPSPFIDIVDLTDPDGAGMAVGAHSNRALVLFEQTEGTSPSQERVLYGQRIGCEPARPPASKKPLDFPRGLFFHVGYGARRVGAGGESDRYLYRSVRDPDLWEARVHRDAQPRAAPRGPLGDRG